MTHTATSIGQETLFIHEAGEIAWSVFKNFDQVIGEDVWAEDCEAAIDTKGTSWVVGEIIRCPRANRECYRLAPMLSLTHALLRILQNLGASGLVGTSGVTRTASIILSMFNVRMGLRSR